MFKVPLLSWKISVAFSQEFSSFSFWAEVHDMFKAGILCQVAQDPMASQLEDLPEG